MKFLLFSALFISAIYYCSAQAANSTTLERLLTRATALEANATAEIAVLRAANRTAAATELAREERAVQQLVAEIITVSATANATVLQRLEAQLAERERTLEQELRRLTANTTSTGARFKRQVTLETLLTRATALEANATAEIAVLRAANRTAAAAELEREERAVQQLVAEIANVSATANATVLQRLQTQLADRERTLAEELRRLTANTTTTGGRFRRQAVTLETLLTRATALEANATAEIAALRAANRTAAATELAREERAIQTLVTDLTNASTTASAAEIRRLEVELAAREAALAVELRLLRNVA